MSDLDRLKNSVVDMENDGSYETVTRLERDLAEAIAAEELGEHFVIKGFVDHLKSEISAIDTLLLTKTSKELSDKERDCLLAKKNLYQDFMYIFTGEKRKQVEQTIKEHLNAISH